MQQQQAYAHHPGYPQPVGYPQYHHPNMPPPPHGYPGYPPPQYRPPPPPAHGYATYTVPQPMAQQPPVHPQQQSVAAATQVTAAPAKRRSSREFADNDHERPTKRQKTG